MTETKSSFILSLCPIPDVICAIPLYPIITPKMDFAPQFLAPLQTISVNTGSAVL